MKYEIGEVLNTAIMTNTISVIVEGTDDIQLYDSLAKSAGKLAEVFPIETIDGFSPGCQNVVLAMDEIIRIPQTRWQHKKYIVGIIDKDVKDFRGEVPTNPLILMLCYYSMESHFVSKEIIPKLLQLCTKISNSMITDDLIEHYFQLISLNDEDFFLLSLESLKSALYPSYDSKFSYGYSEGRILSASDISNVREKKDDLLEFANEQGLSNCLPDLKRFSKGKWLLHYFCYKALKEIDNLKVNCGAHPISPCIMCSTNGKLEGHCLYKTKDAINTKNLKHLIMSNIWISEFDYIRDNFKSMV
ncbi:DUF4435 domain-containing protein [Pantoea phytobeneficialis]|uniref:DUF4435 domain-containing protein n=1 Tax=Pantoea phytobeneficialis TaxID=2052056 RepID=A0AAP9KN12_9GAMM|nr:DUF4435 domain-containing protein [Pantoea phytobeneficialis]MDO6405701.1 DUF4435 domain-containing protein [Pantoea phytobeneficialis]QGR05398.1 hypothetical protein CTZ24_02850 [Pantoea phytobeneficialis]